MRRKKIILGVLLAVLSLLVILGGREIYKYNTMVYRIGISKSPDNRIQHPALTYGANSNFGTSKKAIKKGDEIMREWDEKVASLVLDITLSYNEDKERTLKVEYNVVDGKTEVHLFGEGIPNGETEKKKIEERVLLNYLFEPDKDVIY